MLMYSFRFRSRCLLIFIYLILAVVLFNFVHFAIKNSHSIRYRRERTGSDHVKANHHNPRVEFVSAQRNNPRNDDHRNVIDPVEGSHGKQIVSDTGEHRHVRFIRDSALPHNALPVKDQVGRGIEFGSETGWKFKFNQLPRHGLVKQTKDTHHATDEGKLNLVDGKAEGVFEPKKINRDESNSFGKQSSSLAAKEVPPKKSAFQNQNNPLSAKKDLPQKGSAQNQNNPLAAKEGPPKKGSPTNQNNSLAAKKVPSHRGTIRQPSKKGQHKKSATGTHNNSPAATAVLTEAEVEELRLKVEEVNEKQEISNLDVYGPVTNNTLIILVQVQEGKHLDQLLQSLSGVRGVDECLVVLSHALWRDDTNALVRGVTAFRTLQVFFPFSVQLHPSSFPGEEGACGVGSSGKSKAKPNCRRRNGDYRKAQLAQAKHHWWWQAHRVFEDLRVTRGFTGHVLLLEEQHVVAPDLVHALRLLQALATGTKHVHFLSVGNYLVEDPARAGDKAYIGDWLSPLGLAFTVDTWRLLEAEAEPFCSYDDYNWDWSLHWLLQAKLALRNNTLTAALTRVHHVGPCGPAQHSKTDCASANNSATAVQKMKMAEPHLFPASLQLVPIEKRLFRPTKTFGGWADPRDRKLCVAVAKGNASPLTAL